MGLRRWKYQGPTVPGPAGLVEDCPHCRDILPGHVGTISTRSVIHWGHGSRASAFTLSTVPFAHGLRLPWQHPGCSLAGFQQ